MAVLIGAFAMFDFFMKGWPATRSARAFVAAVRADRLDEARHYATPDLAKRLDPGVMARDTELQRAYESVRRSSEISGGFVGDWTTGCMTGKLDAGPEVWMVMSKLDGSWLVADIRLGMKPSECEDHDAH